MLEDKCRMTNDKFRMKESLRDIILFKLISFDINDAALGEIPSTEELLGRLPEVTVEELERLGIPMGKAFLEMAGTRGQVEQLIKDLPPLVFPKPAPRQEPIPAPRQLTLEQRERCLAKLKVMKIDFRHETQGGFIDFPDWLKEDVIANFDAALAVYKKHGEKKTVKMFAELGAPGLHEILQQYGAAPFIKLMEDFGKSEEYSLFGCALAANVDLIDRFGLVPYLQIAGEAEGNIEIIMNKGLPKLADYIGSAENLVRAGDFLAHKIKNISDPRIRKHLDVCLETFSSSLQNFEAVLIELDRFVFAFERMMALLCPEGEEGSGEIHDNYFANVFRLNKGVLAKTRIAAFESVAERISQLEELGAKGKIQALQIFSRLEGEINSAEDLEGVYGTLTVGLAAYPYQDRPGTYLANLGVLLDYFEDEVSFGQVCEIAAPYRYGVPTGGNHQRDQRRGLAGIVADFGLESLLSLMRTVAQVQQDPLNVLRTYEACKPFMEQQSGFDRFVEMIRSRVQPFSLEGFLAMGDE